MTDLTKAPQQSESGDQARRNGQTDTGSKVAEASAQYLAQAAGTATPASHDCPPGYKRTDVGVIPEDWEIVELSKLTTSHNAGVYKAKSLYGNGTNIVGVGDIYDISKVDGRIFRKVPLTSEEKKRFLLEEGDLIYGESSLVRDGIARTVYVDERGAGTAFAWHTRRYQVNREKVNSVYLYYYLSGSAARSHMINNSITTALTGINTVAYFSCPIFLPSKKEQTAIANALSDVDALISELEKLIAKKQAIKTATMQQLLTGRTRLPQFALREDGTPTNSSGTNLDAGTGGPKGEGQDGLRNGYKQSELGEIPEDWEYISIGRDTVLKARIGWQALTTKEYQTTGDIYLVTGTDFDSGAVKWERCFYVSEWRYKQDQNIQLRNDDVLITKDGTIGKVGYVTELHRPATLNSGVFVIRPKNNNLMQRFLFYVLTSRIFDDFINKITAGSTITHLYQKDFVNFEFPAPCIEEQTAIATILSDMDEEIQALQQRLAKTRQIKQGMMQELLTGRTRLVKPETQRCA
jgi:type I restriction enzyme S subunit